ncbi:MAG: ABC transporter permease [Pedobacter sp.]|nr:MAG: ABC transporter permease [Pedobacter sp.]
MEQLVSFIKKEFYHILRDRRTLLILLGMPVVQIIIFGFALSNEVKNTSIVVFDQSNDAATRHVINAFNSSRYFRVEKSVNTINEVNQVLREGKVKMAVVFPPGFHNELGRPGNTAVQLIVDASDPNLASTVAGYATNIIRDYESARNIRLPHAPMIQPVQRFLYNPEMKAAYNFVPGVMAMVLMLVCTMMTAITIVREKETGTMEVLLVSPVKPIRIIVAKAVPYLLISIFNIGSILLLSVFVLDVPIRGNLLLLTGESILFTITCLAFGLLISSATTSQQTAMFISLVGMFLPTLMLSGFMFPVENMPLPLQLLSNLVPAKWFYIIIKDVMIKGAGFSTVWKETLILLGMLILLTMISLKKFKIRLS